MCQGLNALIAPCSDRDALPKRSVTGSNAGWVYDLSRLFVSFAVRGEINASLRISATILCGMGSRRMG
jgi:hypothetical protein